MHDTAANTAIASPKRHWGIGILGAILAMVAVALLFPQSFAVAQMSLEGRVAKLEQEMRAVQRKVFPGGSDRFFEPEMESAKPATNGSAKDSGGITPELLARLDSLEGSLTRLNARVEEQEAELAALTARVETLETKPAAVVAETPQTASNTAPPAATPKPDPVRVAAVAKIERPNTGDAFEDSYTYGYRLWEAKFYPEAQIALKDTVDKFPKHPRASFARNLLGRAYLDDGKPATSVDIFLGNYNDDPRGERAPDSLIYLAVALTKLNEKPKACLVLEEFVEVYPEVASGRLSGRYKETKANAGCK